jgi:hypothetical protein
MSEYGVLIFLKNHAIVMTTNPPGLYRKARSTMAGIFFRGWLMRDYNKAPITYAEQVSLLQSRGLTITNTSEAVKFLKQVNYTGSALTAYPFKIHAMSLFPVQPLKE